MSASIEARQLVERGLDAADAQTMTAAVCRALANDRQGAWREISREVLRPEHPFEVHRFLFETVYPDWRGGSGAAPAWTPTPEEIASTNVGRLMRERGFRSVAELHAWSVRERENFWRDMIERLGIRFARKHSTLLDVSQGVEQPRWLVGAKLNIVDSCFVAERGKTAVVFHGEDGARTSLSYGQLEALVNRVAGGIVKVGWLPGDAIAVYLPMTIESVAAYLGIIRAGCVAVSIADSLAPEEIATRLRLSAAKGVITQDFLLRGGKRLPLFEKIVQSGAPRAVVISTHESAKLRPEDLDWKGFLGPSDHFEPYLADPHEHTNILFSSGTTGEPKAIPWTHVTPLKCAVDAWLHQDMQSDDRAAWPTNLGWMMGPWLIYASLVNRATMALFGGAPSGSEFGQFVQNANVTMLGVIPSLVKTWRATDCMRSLDWSAVRRFSSTGECSNADDMLYLMSLAGYKPVIEYCGGTELGGGYISSTMAQACVPAAFSTPSFGVELVIVDEDHDPDESSPSRTSRSSADSTASGEAFLVAPSIGMSTELLHHDHHAVYFEGVPVGPGGETLRRHGDALECLGAGYYRALGRVDDTMNLGGIKTGAVEIERVLGAVAGIRDTAAVAVPPRGGGPSLLWIFAVSDADRLETKEDTKGRLQEAIRSHLNPLFKIHEMVLIDSLPRTASNKIMRRLLRDEAVRTMRS